MGAARVRLARLQRRSMFESPVTACPAKHGEDGSRNDAKTQKNRFVSFPNRMATVFFKPLWGNCLFFETHVCEVHNHETTIGACFFLITAISTYPKTEMRLSAFAVFLFSAVK